jgi:hypothetical protein
VQIHFIYYSPKGSLTQQKSNGDLSRGIFTPLNVYPIKFKNYLIGALTYSTGAKTIPLGLDPYQKELLKPFISDFLKRLPASGVAS